RRLDFNVPIDRIVERGANDRRIGSRHRTHLRSMARRSSDSLSETAVLFLCRVNLSTGRQSGGLRLGKSY
ncbi:MAG TPA: hypothetical protein VGG48_12085, partial [Rhizomicrobium sp.]